MDPLPQLETGLEHHQAGRLPEAEAIYRRILAAQPNNPDATHLLGLIESQYLRFDSAIEMIRRAITLNPNAPDYHDNLGLVYQSVSRVNEAIACHRKAAELNPRHLKAHFHLANTLYMQNRFEEAIVEYRLAVSITPGSSDALQNLGTALHRAGKLDESEASLRRALALKPNSADAHNNLGVVLAEMMRYEEAIAEYSEAVRYRPDFAPALSNLGAALRLRGQHQKAIEVLRKSQQLAPNVPETLNNLGIALKDTGQLDEAIKVFDRCLALKPTQRDALNNLANAHKDCGNIQDAVAHYARSLAIGPDYRIHSNMTYTLQFHPGYDDESLFREQRRWNELYAMPLAQSVRPHQNDRDPNRRLKVGYVSAYFYAQAESFFVVPLLEKHDLEQFEIHCYSSVIKPDSVTARLKSKPLVWHDVLGRPDADVAEQIRRDRIDVLIDLAMHMAHNRLPTFARKPAPVQVTWLAYPGGTGLDAMDYRITDGFMDPPDKPATYYREESIRLADCWCCYDPLTDAGPAAARNGGPIRFASINNPCKNNEPLLRLWARVMQSAPDSTILILASGEGHRNKLRGILQSAGIAPQRVEFVDRISRTDYLRHHDSIDICLDTLPYNGITTTCDALWMGVPVVTLIGKTASGRAGLSILSTLGMPELIAKTEDDFVKIAADLSQDRPRLNELRSTLRERMRQSPLMDAAGFARKMETAYRDMWRRWCGR
ncbi:MAG TPA: tetratricopeptide repeat protein [Tepidisphaeraceae bacterium]|nr:tetratricopeptide repeat protein [Tepidisphaeraceae bacterium]